MEEFIKKSKKGVALFVGSIVEVANASVEEKDLEYARMQETLKTIEKQTKNLIQAFTENTKVLENVAKSKDLAVNTATKPFTQSEFNPKYDEICANSTRSSSLSSLIVIQGNNIKNDVISEQLTKYVEMIDFANNISEKRRKYQLLLHEADLEIKHIKEESTENAHKYKRKFEKYTRDYISTVQDIANKKNSVFSKTMNAFIFHSKSMINDCAVVVNK